MTATANSTRQNRPHGRMTGGRALAEMLRLSGAGPMFGMGGFQLLPFYDALGQLGMQHFLINDERCGAFAADAYARVTNRPGICDGTLGPGATNLVTGLIEVAEWRDTDRCARGRHQPGALVEEHDAGMPPGRDPAAGGQGADPDRGYQPHPGADPPRLRGRDLGPARGRCCSTSPRMCATAAMSSPPTISRSIRRRWRRRRGASVPTAPTSSAPRG